tara:strand:+ start:270 stop:419 length:150 start_codon:yes stop_codon:yes gene_type:complete
MITLKNVKGLERHAYAPEMNKLHLSSGKIYKVPQQTNINDAIRYINSRL